MSRENLFLKFANRQCSHQPVQLQRLAIILKFCMKQVQLKIVPSREQITNEPWHEISNNVVCAISKASDQPAHTRSLVRAFAIVARIFYDC